MAQPGTWHPEPEQMEAWARELAAQMQPQAQPTRPQGEAMGRVDVSPAIDAYMKQVLGSEPSVPPTNNADGSISGVLRDVWDRGGQTGMPVSRGALVAARGQRPMSQAFSSSFTGPTGNYGPGQQPRGIEQILRLILQLMGDR